MVHAYAEIYLDDAMCNLGDMFAYAVNDCGLDADAFFSHFIISGVAEAFGKGNPKYVAGLSGPALALEVIRRTTGQQPDIPASENFDKSEAYWAGWVLAYYQWYSALRFSYLQNHGLTMSTFLSLYPAFHEADISKFVSFADDWIENSKSACMSSLKKRRKRMGLTQRELAEASETSLSMIQRYEQQRDINKARAQTLLQIARVLNCGIEDLLD